MNAKSHTLEVSVGSIRQAEEAILSIFHTIMLHRSHGKFCYRQDESYTEGCIGFEDVRCDFIDFTYIRMSSDNLIQVMSKHVSEFMVDMGRKRAELSQDVLSTIKGTLKIEFHKTCRSKWSSYFDQSQPWEVWNIVLSINELTTNKEHRLDEKILYVIEAMNKHHFTPKMPKQSELDWVFDTSFPDVQPYLFKISHKIYSG